MEQGKETQLEQDILQFKQLAAKITSQIDDKILHLQQIELLYADKIDKFTNNKVKLDVGGKIFSVSLKTLQQEDSFFSAMFSGRFKLEKDEEDNSYFIDRNPEYFEVILDYLRTGTIRLSKFTTEELEELEDEVKFYQIPSLVKLFENTCCFDPKRSQNFTLSNKNSEAKFSGGVHSIATTQNPVREWQFIIGQVHDHFDRVGFISEQEAQGKLNYSLSTFGISPQGLSYIRNDIKILERLSVAVKSNDNVKFHVDSTGMVSIWVNDKPCARYQLPPNFGIPYPAFSSQNIGSWVKLLSFTDENH